MSMFARGPAAVLVLAGLVITGCDHPEERLLPAPLTKIRFGSSVAKVHAAREGATFETADCPEGSSADVCEKEQIDELGDVYYDYEEGDLVAVRISGDLEDYAPGRLLGDVATFRDRSKLPPPTVHLETLPVARAARADWQDDGWKVSLVRRVFDKLEVASALGVASTLTEDGVGASTFVEFEVRPPDTDVPAPEGETADLQAASEALDDFLGTCDEKLTLFKALNSGTVGEEQCRKLPQYRDVPEAFCSSLAEAIQTGRTSRGGRKIIREYIKSRGYRKFTGFIVARVGDDVYEVAPMRRGYWGWTVSDGQHSILETTMTEYGSRGRFSLWVRHAGTREIETKNGFTQNWDVLVEDKLGTAINAVFDAPAGDETSEAARSVLVAVMQGAVDV